MHKDDDTLYSNDAKYYEAVTPDSLAERLAVWARDRIYDDFCRVCRPQPEETILDVGVSQVIGAAANALERRYPYPDRITAAGLGPGDEFRAAFPRVAFQRIAPNQPLPFADASFDIVTSNAVLEHVGSRDNQRRFVAELMRVGRRAFVTVPHRFFPVEHHTAVPLLHWTDRTFALACRALGKRDWSRPENLILMSRRRLRAACPPGVRAEIGATGIPLGPFSANLYLYVSTRNEARYVSGLSSPRAPSAHGLVPWGKPGSRACPWHEQGEPFEPLEHWVPAFAQGCPGKMLIQASLVFSVCQAIQIVMPGRDPGIHGDRRGPCRLWMAGSSPAMTISACDVHQRNITGCP